LQRVIVYIDGFNLYYGLKERGWKRYYWLDLRELSRAMCKQYMELSVTKYFTSIISRTDPGKENRQKVYLEALQTLPYFRIYYGHFLPKTIQCRSCGDCWQTYEEKMTDVCIGTELLTDAFQDRFDIAIVVSGDSDLSPPIEAVRKHFPDKRIIVGFPPSRTSMKLRKTANGFFNIGEKKLKRSMLPDKVIKADGHTLHRPEEWRKNIKPERKK